MTVNPPAPGPDAAAPAYALPEHIRVCFTDTAAIFLDLRRNRYFGLDAIRSRVLASLLQGGAPDEGVAADSRQRPLAAFLMEQQLLQPGHTGTIARHRPTLPKARISVGQQLTQTTRLRPEALWRFAQACHWSRRLIQRGTLYDAVCEFERDRQVSGVPRDPDTTPRILELTLVFRRLRPYVFAAREQCLLHALTLARFLALQQLHAHWVIGVRTHPWKAHSWVQHGEHVLDATPEQVAQYTPVLVA